MAKLIFVFWISLRTSLETEARSWIRARAACQFGNSIRTETHDLLIALIREAAGTFETSVSVYPATRRNNPEDSHRGPILWLESQEERDHF
jgi:hypothetical protein